MDVFRTIVVVLTTLLRDGFAVTDEDLEGLGTRVVLLVFAFVVIVGSQPCRGRHRESPLTMQKQVAHCTSLGSQLCPSVHLPAWTAGTKWKVIESIETVS